jgi:thioester reductase-like protein
MNIFLTGATGFLGTVLLRDLLLKGHNVTALVRAKDGTTTLRRLSQCLHEYDPWFPLDKHTGKTLHVVRGDVACKNFGLDAKEYHRCAHSSDIIINNAATTALDTDWKTYEEINIGGTREAINFASQTRQKSIAQISSAYVAGDRTDIVYEDQLDLAVGFRNKYERSKAISESDVRNAGATKGIRFMILRPSIIIGDSQSGRMSEEHHLFNFLLRLFWARQMIYKRMNSSKSEHGDRFRILGNANTTKNFVPVDYVADLASILIGTKGAWGKSFHLTHPHPLRLGALDAYIRKAMDWPGFTLCPIETTKDLSPLEKRFFRTIKVYEQYFWEEPTFDQSQLKAILGKHLPKPMPISQDAVNRLVRFVLEKFRRRKNIPERL